MIDYQTISEHDLGAGIDVRSSENLLAPGFFEDILNGTIIERRIKKRKGYQQQAGYVPVRVNQITYTSDSENNIRFDLDSNVSLANIATSPILVHGRVGREEFTSGSFSNTEDTTEYFSAFSADPRETLSAPSGTLSIPASSHGLDSNVFFTGVAQSLSTSDFSSSVLIPDEIRIDRATLDVSIDYQVSEDISTFTYFSNKEAVAGSTYISPTNTTTSFSIPANTHGLSTFNIIARVFEETASEFIQVLPQSVSINSTTGQVIVGLTQAITGFVVLSAAPATNVVNGTVAGLSSVTISVPNFSADKFPIVAAYLEPVTSLNTGSSFSEVIPDSIIYDDISGALDITFTNSSHNSGSFEVYYEAGAIISNQLFVTGNPVAEAFAYTDTTPQLTIWGLCHEDIYTESDQRQGWVTHIDTYRRPGEERLIVGLGGNLFAERTIEEVGDLYEMPILFPRLNNRVLDDIIIGPAFYDTGDTVNRTRGYITSDTSGTNWAEVSSVSYNETTGNSDYILSTPNIAVLDSEGMSTDINNVISTVINEEDHLTIKDMGWRSHNGTFKVTEIEVIDANSLRISVDNPTLNCVDFNEVDAGGLAGIFTDQLQTTAPSEFVAGDVINSELFARNFILTTITSSASSLVISGAVSILSVPQGLRMVARRTSSIIPIRDDRNNPSVRNIVQGDSLSYGSLERKLRTKSVNVKGNRSAQIAGDGFFATVTLDADTIEDLSVGSSVFFINSQQFSGEHTISRIIDASSFEIESSLNLSLAATLLGNYIEIDEKLEWEDTSDQSTFVQVDSRWIPIEAPRDNQDLTPNTHIRQFDVGNYIDQATVRSTMVNDNMYFTNGNDEVMKFDGTSIYRAGLFSWQPGLFVTLDNSQPGVIVTNTPTVSVNSIEENQFIVDIGDETKYLVNDRIRHDDGTNTFDYTITATNDDGRITVNRDIESSVIGSISRISTYRYYFRLNAVDANNNLIAGAVTGSESFRVDVGEDTAIHMKLVGMPAWDIYDYDRLEVEIYRTVAGEAPGENGPIFYRITNLPMSFNREDGYLTFTDTIQDEELQSGLQIDEVAGIEPDINIRTRWSEPLRAKYISSTGNRLVLANLQDYPQLDVQLYNQDNLAQNSDLDGTLWSFRRESLDNDNITETNMIDTVRYEWQDRDTATVLPLDALLTVVNNNVNISGLINAAEGDWIYIFHSEKGPAHTPALAGWHQLHTVFTGATSGSIRYKHDGTETITVDSVIQASQSGDIPVLIGQDGNRDTRTDANSSILRATSSATARLAEAINASMRVTQTQNFTPWLIANAGDEFQAGQLLVRKPRVDVELPEMQIDSNLSDGLDVFVNGLRRVPGAQATMTERIYPSRVIQSYPNFPEIFNNPNTITDTSTGDVRDINSADGQEVTGIIPFFGDSTTSDSQRESIMIAFKTNSVYAYNSANFVDPQKLETQGLGCTAPYSIALSRNSVIFANNSGIYSINTSLQFGYVGRRMERNWLESVNEDQLALAQGHNFARDRQYKLSVPVDTNTANSEVYVYDHTRESAESIGGWTRYDNHPSTGWANKQSNAFFGTTLGRVFSIRDAGDASDFRDDDQAIVWDVKYRAMDFGDAAARKTLISIVSHFRSIVQSANTILEVATNLNRAFEATDAFTLSFSDEETALSDRQNRAVISLRSSVNRRKFVYLQVRYRNDGIDEPVELAGVDFRASLLSRKGIGEASDT